MVLTENRSGRFLFRRCAWARYDRIGWRGRRTEHLKERFGVLVRLDHPRSTQREPEFVRLRTILLGLRFARRNQALNALLC